MASGKELLDFLSRRRANGDGIAGVLSLEGAHALRGNLANVECSMKAGFRIVRLTHLFDNALAARHRHAAIRNAKQSRRENPRRRRPIIDLAHASPALIKSVLDLMRDLSW